MLIAAAGSQPSHLRFNLSIYTSFKHLERADRILERCLPRERGPLLLVEEEVDTSSFCATTLMHGLNMMVSTYVWLIVCPKIAFPAWRRLLLPRLSMSILQSTEHSRKVS